MAVTIKTEQEIELMRIAVHKLESVLKAAGCIYVVTGVLGVAIPDTPGGLNKILQALTDARVNVEYMYAFLGGKAVDHAYMIFRVADNAAAAAALAARGIQVVEQDEMDRL